MQPRPSAETSSPWPSFRLSMHGTLLNRRRSTLCAMQVSDGVPGALETDA
jgi:hypothetical protein